MNKIHLFDLDIDNITLEETTEKILEGIKNNKFIVREDVNAAKIIKYRK
jgi:UDP-N-acetyl-D-mannosaminuronic acid transferase (WecB/TagA/CpsF family)